MTRRPAARALRGAPRFHLLRPGLRLGAAALLALTLSTGCGDSTGPKIGPPASVTMQAGDGQTAQVGTAVAVRPSVKVTDAQGNAVPNVAVSFAVASGGGTVAGGSATTDASGLASAGGWTLGTTAGANTLTATVAGASSATFTATGTAGPAATITKQAGDSQTGTAGQALAVQPAVRVTDQHGNVIANLAVVFAVASGGGSIAGGSAMTNASGVATAGAWTLGTAAGPNTLTVTAGSAPAVTFTATGSAGAASQLTAQAGDNQSAVAGSTVAIAPSVLVRDAAGNPVSGASVTFAVASGGGSITGATVQTGANGQAAVGSWRLGATVGTNTLTATVGNLPAVTFTATGTVGPAALLTKTAGDNQTATTSTPLPIAPQVRVTDANANPISGASVTFTVASGGGTVIGGTTATNAQGFASVGQWMLGAATGANTLTASSPGLTPVTFTATATSACAAAAPYSIGATVNGTLTNNSCLVGGLYRTDLFTLTTAQPMALQVTQSSTQFVPYIDMLRPNGVYIADRLGDASNPARFNVLLPPGTYTLRASTGEADRVGTYTLTSSVINNPDVTNCDEWYLGAPFTLQQTLNANDCPDVIGGNTFRFDRYIFYMEAGRTYTISMSSAAFDTYLELRAENRVTILASNNNFGGSSNSQIVFVAPTSGYRMIHASNASVTGTGSYTLVVSVQ